MVLTEDDYVDFLLWFASEWQNSRLLPGAIRKALSATSLLFVGYSRNDWSFRVLFRGLVKTIAASQGMKSVAVQLTPLPPGTPDEMLRKAEEYLEEYYRMTQRIPVCVYWGTAARFAHELRDRYKAYVDARQSA